MNDDGSFALALLGRPAVAHNEFNQRQSRGQVIARTRGPQDDARCFNRHEPEYHRSGVGVTSRLSRGEDARVDPEGSCRHTGFIDRAGLEPVTLRLTEGKRPFRRLLRRCSSGGLELSGRREARLRQRKHRRREPGGLQYRREQVPADRRRELSVSDVLYPVRRHTQGVRSYRCRDGVRLSCRFVRSRPRLITVPRSRKSSV